MRVLFLLPLLFLATPTPPVGVGVGVTHEHVEPRSDRVVGSSRSNVYHRPSCRHARRIRPANLVEWRSESAARAAGYRACRVCRPG